MIFVITGNISILEEKRLLMKGFVVFFDRSFKFGLKRGDNEFKGLTIISLPLSLIRNENWSVP